MQRRREDREQEREQREKEQDQLARDRAVAEAVELEKKEDEVISGFSAHPTMNGLRHRRRTFSEVLLHHSACQ